MKLVVILILLTIQIPINVHSQTEIPFISLNSDRAVYHPKDTVLLVVAGNQNESGSVAIYYETDIIHEYSFNDTLEPKQFLWLIEPHAVNGSYRAVAKYDNIEFSVTNATVHFDVYRNDVQQYYERFYPLELNVTFYFLNSQIKNWDLYVTNLWTEETTDYEEIEGTLIKTLDDYDDLILYKIGNAIELKAESIDDRYLGILVIPALEGMNIITIYGDKVRDPNYMLNFAFLGLSVFACVIIVVQVRKNIRSRREDLRRENPMTFPEREY